MIEPESKQPASCPNKAPGPIERPISTPLRPPGVLPRYAQAWVIGGLALVMALVIAFSGGNTPKPKQSPSPALTVNDPNSGQIEDYRRRIEEETRKLNEEKLRWAKERAAQMTAPDASGSHDRGPGASTSVYGAAPENNWIEEDRQKRNYQSLYSSNLALSYRELPAPDRVPIGALEHELAKFKSLRHVQDQDSETTDDDAHKRKSQDSKIDEAVGPQYRLFEGTFLEAVLTNRLDGVFSGPVNCMTTTDIDSHNGLHVLIPAGTRVLGEVKRVDTFGQERLAVVFHRLIMPDGYTVSLDKFGGLNQIGETGLRDKINHHYLQVFGVSIALGAIGGLSAANTSSGAQVSAADYYRQGVAESLSQSSMRILDRYLSVLPTITIREGQRVKIYLTDDLLLPAYENHRMPNDL